MIVGSDSPTLPIERPAEAFACLEEGADAAVVPAEDGGYCLLGARRALPDLFAGISWGTAEVLRATIAAARRSGLRLSLLDPWHDVDTPEDLLRLAREIAVSPAARRPRRTAALIGALRRRGRL